ncbi:MAG: DsbA family protein [Candidatus Peribacteraceae bacterium]|nr:DsbA family protein [Candidatus Peribacteraceae bacterium]
MNSPQNSNVWFAVSLGLLGVIVGYSAASFTGSGTGDAIAQNPPSAPAVVAPPEDVPGGPVPAVDASADPIRGDSKAKLTVITYSDFQCPYSKRHHPTLAKVLETYKNDVNVVYRHYPLSFHPNAQKLAEGSECAKELGGSAMFWKYADAVYGDTEGTDFTSAAIVALAPKIGLNEAKFKSCLDSGKYAQKISDEMQAGSSAGVRGTPGSFVYDNRTKKSRYISGAQPFDAFKSAIDAMLAGS